MCTCRNHDKASSWGVTSWWTFFKYNTFLFEANISLVVTESHSHYEVLVHSLAGYTLQSQSVHINEWVDSFQLPFKVWSIMINQFKCFGWHSGLTKVCYGLFLQAVPFIIQPSPTGAWKLFWFCAKLDKSLVLTFHMTATGWIITIDSDCPFFFQHFFYNPKIN